MCGIYSILFSHETKQDKTLLDNYYQLGIKNIEKLNHRGPDSTGYWNNNHVHLGHKRLSIINPTGRNQPIIFSHPDNPNHKIILTINGEIYNYKKLKSKWLPDNYELCSDCEVVAAGYIYYAKQKMYDLTLDHHNIIRFLSELEGQFSFVLYDELNNYTLIVRDPIGITPMYIGKDSNYNNIFVASELKALENCEDVGSFPPGCYMYFKNLGNFYNNINIKPYYLNSPEGEWLKTEYKQSEIIDVKDKNEPLLGEIRELFTNCVIKRLMSDVPFGILLSGGLDSSLVCSIAVKYIKENPHLFPNLNFKDIHTFSIGLDNSPDLKYAKKVADFLGTTHYNFTFTVQEGIDCLKEIIYCLETYDITTIRASIPMYLLARKIRQTTDIKMLLSGEGSDEILGGYLYFHKAPSDKEHQQECVRRIYDLNFFDCLRANKSTMAYSLEARVPFLDKEFISKCIHLHKDVKTVEGIEKYVLRNAFNIRENNDVHGVYLPDEILWRQKEQFSDGVGYEWIDTLKNIHEHFDITSIYPDLDINNEFVNRYTKYKINPPQTKEALIYRLIFNYHFPNRDNDDNNVKTWVPNTSWGDVDSDPSGRVQKNHINSL
jgi:asparagine synthase (glutamine-hydrolysing)